MAYNLIKESFTDKVLDFQSYLKNRMALGEVEEKRDTCEWNHYFIPGGYAREMFIPKGLIVIGRVHKYDCITIVSKGRLLLASTDGPQDVTSGSTSITKAGTQRIAISMEDSLITTFHVTEETDLDKIEDELTVSTYEEFLTLEERKLL